MERKLIDYLPYVIRDYAEFQGIMGSEQPEVEKAWNTTDDLLDNQFIPTAGNMGLSRWEKILGITPKGTDSLEDRRFRILTRISRGSSGGNCRYLLLCGLVICVFGRFFISCACK